MAQKGRLLRSWVPLLAAGAIVLAFPFLNERSVREESLTSPVAKNKWTLRFDWTSLPPTSPLAKRISAVQTQCKPSKRIRRFCHNQAGVGSNLHTWAQALCAAMEQDALIVTESPWPWMDEEHCSSEKYPMLCYFGHGHLPEGGQCNSSDLSASEMSITATPWLGNPKICPTPSMRRSLLNFEPCPSFMNKESTAREFMAAAMEYLFQSVQPVVIAEAKRQAQDAFPTGLPNPENMITVHMRWGDKATETGANLPAESFIRGVEHLLQARQVQSPIHIYLASEDIDAITAFTDLAPKHWLIHMSGPTQEGTDKHMLNFRSGSVGLSSFGALLLSMQSNHYVLATTSNWSRLINELRMNIVDPRCENCTSMIDLQSGMWPHEHQDGTVTYDEFFDKPTVLR